MLQPWQMKAFLEKIGAPDGDGVRVYLSTTPSLSFCGAAKLEDKGSYLVITPQSAAPGEDEVIAIPCDQIAAIARIQ